MVRQGLCPRVEEGAVVKGYLSWVEPGVPDSCCGVTMYLALAPEICCNNCKCPWNRKAVKVTGMSSRACLVAVHKDCSLCSLLRQGLSKCFLLMHFPLKSRSRMRK